MEEAGCITNMERNGRWVPLAKPYAILKQICILYIVNTRKEVFNERGKAGGHKPPLFPLSYHILAFFSSGSHEPFPFRTATFDFSGQNYFFKWYIGPLKCDF